LVPAVHNASHDGYRRWLSSPFGGSTTM